MAIVSMEIAMDKRAVLLLMTHDEVGHYLATRRIKIAGTSITALAERLGVTRSQASDLLYGRAPFGPKMVERLNTADPEYELIEVLALVRKKPGGLDVAL